MNMGIAIYASVTMILRRQDPIKTLSWTAVMVLLPYIGILLYFVFGQNFRKKKIFSRKGLGDVKLRQELCVDEEEKLKKDPQLFSADNEPYKKLVYQNLKNSYALIDYNSDIDFYFDGRAALDAMYKAIGEAKHHIHIQTYILEDDATGNKSVVQTC
jgi:cardiolipin synthase